MPSFLPSTLILRLVRAYLALPGARYALILSEFQTSWFHKLAWGRPVTLKSLAASSGGGGIAAEPSAACPVLVLCQRPGIFTAALRQLHPRSCSHGVGPLGGWLWCDRRTFGRVDAARPAGHILGRSTVRAFQSSSDTPIVEFSLHGGRPISRTSPERLQAET